MVLNLAQSNAVTHRASVTPKQCQQQWKVVTLVPVHSGMLDRGLRYRLVYSIICNHTEIGYLLKRCYLPQSRTETTTKTTRVPPSFLVGGKIIHFDVTWESYI